MGRGMDTIVVKVDRRLSYCGLCGYNVEITWTWEVHYNEYGNVVKVTDPYCYELGIVCPTCGRLQC
jgi:hypothetical protein